MFGQFADALSQYWTRGPGGSITWTNGTVSLRQIHLLRVMAQRGARMDKGTFQKIREGKEGRLFTISQLEVFCEVMELSPDQTVELLWALLMDDKLRKDTPANRFLSRFTLKYRDKGKG
jgi:hypothetical protein